MSLFYQKQRCSARNKTVRAINRKKTLFYEGFGRKAEQLIYYIKLLFRRVCEAQDKYTKSLLMSFTLGKVYARKKKSVWNHIVCFVRSIWVYDLYKEDFQGSVVYGWDDSSFRRVYSVSLDDVFCCCPYEGEQLEYYEEEGLCYVSEVLQCKFEVLHVLQFLWGEFETALCELRCFGEGRGKVLSLLWYRPT